MLAEKEGLQGRTEIKACPPNLAGSLKRMVGRRCCLSSLTASTEFFERWVAGNRKYRGFTKNRLIIRNLAWIKAELADVSFAVAACLLWQLGLSVFERWVAKYKNKKTSQNRMIIRDLARLGAELAEGSFAVATECFWAVLGGRQKTERLHKNGLRSSIRKNSKGYQILAPNLAGPWEGSFDGEEMQLLRSCHNGGHTCRSVKEIRF
jgi:hypothetical protein